MQLKFYGHQAVRWGTFALVPALILGLIVYGVEKRQPKVYQVTVKLYVQPAGSVSQGGQTGQTVQSGVALATAYSQILIDPVIEAGVDKAMAPSYPGYHVARHSFATVATKGADAPIIAYSVQDTNRQRAADAANMVAQVFIKHIQSIQSAHFGIDARSLNAQVQSAQKNIQQLTKQIAGYTGSPSGLDNLKASLSAYQTTYQSLLNTLNQFNVQRDALLNQVTVYSPAVVPKSPIGPQPFRTGLLAALATFILCAGGMYAYNYLDDSPRSPEEVEAIAGAPILGTVQRFNTQRIGTQLVTEKLPQSPISEAYRVVRTNLQFTNVDHPPHTIVVTSCIPKEGKSTTASNLARVFADGGFPVVLIDADLRRPSLHAIFPDTDRQNGLSNLIISGQVNGHLPTPTDNPNLKVIVSGPIPPNPADLLGSQRMRSILTQLQQEATMVVIDTPPVLALSDAVLLSAIVDGSILVVDPGKSKRRDIKRTREAIEGVGGKILGVVVNGLAPRGRGYYYYYQHYQYQYQYGYSSQSGKGGTSGKGGSTGDGSRSSRKRVDPKYSGQGS